MTEPFTLGSGRITKQATISGCGKYRYDLWRRWDDGLKAVNFVMLNPSVADASIDDPTVRRCVDFAKRWGYGSIVVTNLFAYRATDPFELYHCEDPIGPLNDEFLDRSAADAGLVVAAWGALGVMNGRFPVVLRRLREAGIVPHCLKRNNGGSPGHPLYLPANSFPIPMEVYP